MTTQPHTQGFNLFDPRLLTDPHAVYGPERDREPTQHVEALGMWVALGYEGTRAIMRKTDTLMGYEGTQRARQGDGVVDEPYYRSMQHFVLFKEGKDHARIRRSFSKHLIPRRVDAILPRMQERAEELLDQVAGDGRANLVEAYTNPLPLSTISELLGVPAGVDGQLVEWLDNFRPAIVFAPMTPEQLAAANDAVQGLESFFRDLAVQRRKAPGDDLLSALLSEVDAGNLSEDEMIVNAYGLYFAGHDTSMHGIGNTFIGLFRSPEQLELVRADPSLALAAAEEGLRLEHPAAGNFRVLPEEMEVDGKVIPGGCPVVFVVPSANRDPRQFACPERFDLHRTEENVNFGVGRKNCPGKHLARASMEIALNTALRRLPNLRLDPGAEIEWSTSPVLHGPTVLPVLWDPA